MSTKLSDRRKMLQALLDSGNYIFFFGAGVSVEAGLKPWGAALKSLADDLEASDDDTVRIHAPAVRSQVAQNRLLEAAEHFYLVPLSPENRSRALQRVFGAPAQITPRLRRLAAQRYRAVVTTNFDTAFLQAATLEKVHLTQFGESDLSDARSSQGRFLLRLHGRIEAPSTIVLTRSHYERLRTRPDYPFLIQTMMTDQPFIFFGFSFADPFFVTLLENLRAASGSRMHHESYALLSQEPEPGLALLLDGLNIKALVYSPDENHEEAWSLLARQLPPSPISEEHYSERRIRSTLAAVLTHLKLRGQPDLRSAVLGAAALSAIETFGTGTISETVEQVRTHLALPPSASELVKSAVAGLISSQRLRLVGDKIFLPEDAADSKTDQSNGMSRLVQGILARAAVRYAFRRHRTFDYESCLQEVLLRVLAADGMSLAHTFVRRQMIGAERVEGLVSEAVATLDTSARRHLEPLRSAIVGLLTRPERDEEEILDQFASVAFVTCLSLNDPTITSLAERIHRSPAFLDASIVLPWISEGHPSEAMYGSIVEFLGEPSIAEPYLNEIVSHRELAIREFEEARLGDRNRFSRYARYFSLNNVNTFVGGYGSFLSIDDDGSFDDYLKRVAPFTTEGEAADYLRRRGLNVRPLGRIMSNVGHLRQLIADSVTRVRNPIRLQHDAHMIGYLLDQKAATRPFFVTADRALMSALAQSQYGDVIASMLFPHQAFTLAQMAGRSKGIVRGLARTVFGISRDSSKQLREFYTDRVLAEYEPALVSAVPEIVETIVAESEDLRSSLAPGPDDQDAVNDRVRRFAVLDQFEPRFHETMSREKTKRGL